MNRIPRLASLLCSIALALAACGEAPVTVDAMEGSGDAELKRLAGATFNTSATTFTGVRTGTAQPSGQPPVVLGATYDLGIAACLGLGGGLSNSEINDLRDCCEDSRCGFVQSTTRIDGHLCAEVSCNCGPDELNGWNYALGDNNDDLAFLECASGL